MAVGRFDALQIFTLHPGYILAKAPLFLSGPVKTLQDSVSPAVLTEDGEEKL